METETNTKSRARSSKSTNRKAQNSQSEGVSSQSNISIDENFFESKRVKNNDVTYLKPPKPESAPNKFIAKLFESPQTNTIQVFWVKERVINFMKILGKRRINMTMLRSLAFRGVPSDVPGLRPIVWRVILGYLPRETSKWDAYLKQQKQIYDEWKKDLIVEPYLIDSASGKIASDTISPLDFQTLDKSFDHPLSVGNSSLWNQFFKDQELWEEIEKDVRRTRSDISFFIEAVDRQKNQDKEQLKKQAEVKKAHLHGDTRLHYIETHADVLSRMLFIYGKLNPGVRYVQGMNEILAVIYYCFWPHLENYANVDDDPFAEYFESDLFFCFTMLMAEIRDGFLRTMDNEPTGINGKIRTFSQLMLKIDPELYYHLQEQNVNPQFFSLRWLMLLLSQEFSITNVIRLWDTLLADQERFLFLNFVCVAMVQVKRDMIMSGDFSECMEALQRQGQENDPKKIKQLLDQAKKIAQKYTHKYDNFIESGNGTMGFGTLV